MFARSFQESEPDCWNVGVDNFEEGTNYLQFRGIPGISLQPQLPTTSHRPQDIPCAKATRSGERRNFTKAAKID